MLNRKGITLPFVVTVLLALIIFIPACILVSKVFRVSEQADNSFNDFVKSMIDFSKSDKNQENFLLIMDAETFIAAFRYPTTAEIQAESRKTGGGTFRSSGEKTTVVSTYFSYPAQCTALPCICLCRKAREGEAATQPDTKFISYTCEQLRCTMLEDFPLNENWGLSRLTKEEPRRVLIEMKKENNQIILTAKK